MSLSSSDKRITQQRVSVQIEELCMKIKFPCEIMFSLKGKEESVSDKDKYFFQGGTIFPNSVMELVVEPEEPLEILIFISSKNLLTEAGFISLNKTR